MPNQTMKSSSSMSTRAPRPIRNNLKLYEWHSETDLPRGFKYHGYVNIEMACRKTTNSPAPQTLIHDGKDQPTPPLLISVWQTM